MSGTNIVQTPLESIDGDTQAVTDAPEAWSRDRDASMYKRFQLHAQHESKRRANPLLDKVHLLRTFNKGSGSRKIFPGLDDWGVGDSTADLEKLDDTDDAEGLQEIEEDYDRLQTQMNQLPEGIVKRAMDEAAQALEVKIANLKEEVRQREERESQRRQAVEAKKRAQLEAQRKIQQQAQRLREMTDLQTAIRNAGANVHLKHEVRRKLRAHKNRIEQARRAGKTIWIQAYDPALRSIYYRHPTTQQIRWDRPEFFVFPDEDEQMRSVICIQCMYRAKIARRRYMMDSKYAEVDPATIAMRKKARRALDRKMDQVNRRIMEKHETYLAQRLRICTEKQQREIAAKGPQATQWKAIYSSSKSKVYYYNKVSKQTVWKKPAAFVLVVSAEELKGCVRIQLMYRAKVCRDRLRAALMEVKGNIDWEAKRKRGVHIIERQLEKVNQEKADLKRKTEEHLRKLQEQLGDGEQEWIESYDPEREKFYYYNAQTGETSWTKPDSYVMAADNALMSACLRIQSSYRAKKAREALRNKMYEDAKLDPELQKKFDPERWKKDLERKKKEEEEMLLEMRRKEVAEKHKPWEPPSLDEAKRVRDGLIFHGGSAKYFKTTIAMLGQEMGCGISLYFIFIRMLSNFFFLATLLAFPAIYFNYCGRGLLQDDVDPMGFALFTAGNLGINWDGITNLDKFCDREGPYAGHCCVLPAFEQANRRFCNTTVPEKTTDVCGSSWRANRLSYLTAFMDVFVSLCFLCFIAMFKVVIDREVAEADARVISAADYAVIVHGLPNTTTESEIRDHFSQLYEADKAHVALPLHCGCWGNGTERDQIAAMAKYAPGQRPKAVIDVQHLMDGDKEHAKTYLNSWVAEVSVAHPSGDEIRKYLKNKELTRKINRLEREVKKWSQDTRFEGGPDEKKRLKAEAKLYKVKSKFDKFNNKLTQQAGGKSKLNPMNVCVCAYVVFNNEESYARCLDDYRTSASSLNRRFQPSHLRFKNKQGGAFALNVQAAPEPNDIIWENLETTYIQRFVRKMVSNFIAFLFLLTSFSIIYVAQLAQVKAANQFKDLRLCKDVIPSFDFGHANFVSDPPKPVRLEEKEWSTCRTNQTESKVYFIEFQRETQETRNGTLPTAYPTAYPTTSSDTLNSTTKSIDLNFEMCANPCVSWQDKEQCSCSSWQQDAFGDSRCAGYPRSTRLSCYCHDKLLSSLQKSNVFEGTKKMLKDEVCGDFARYYLLANGLLVGSAVAIVVINLLLKEVLKLLTFVERHDSVSSAASSLTMKLFLGQYLNTAMIVLLVNAQLPNVDLGLSFLLAGPYDDFDQKWFSVVGASVSLTMAVNIFVPHISPLGKLLLQSYNRYRKQGKVQTQEQLNELYSGLPYEIDERYPVILNTLFVTMMYCTGIPILIPFAAVGYMVTGYIDKLMLLRVYKKPFYDQNLAVMSWSLLPYALLLHLGFATWMYGNEQVFDSGIIDISKFGFKGGDANEMYDNLMKWMGKNDPLGEKGLAPRVIRMNTIPLFAVLLVLVVYLLFRKTVGKCLLRVYRRFMWVLARGSYDLGERISAEEWPISSYTKMFAQRIAVHLERKLTDKEKAQGWHYDFDKMGNRTLYRSHPENRMMYGVPHRKNEKMKTWQAMTGIHSYRIMQNPHYAEALEHSAMFNYKLSGIAAMTMEERTNAYFKSLLAEPNAVKSVFNSMPSLLEFLRTNDPDLLKGLASGDEGKDRALHESEVQKLRDLLEKKEPKLLEKLIKHWEAQQTAIENARAAKEEAAKEAALNMPGNEETPDNESLAKDKAVKETPAPALDGKVHPEN